MRNLMELKAYMIDHPTLGVGDSYGGAFRVPYIRGRVMTNIRLGVIASSAEEWDHVSVSLRDRCPTWEEMSYIHRLFFLPHEVAMQLHVPLVDHVDIHPYCLHLWRPWRPGGIMLPPKGAV